MNLFKISYKNGISKPLNAFLSLALLALSVALISMSLQLQENVSDMTKKNTSGIDMVVGAKGSPLQLILSSVLHIDAPTGNVNYTDAKKIINNPLVERAVPISYGDNYKGYRIVGTTNGFQKIYHATIGPGKNCEHPLEVVLGANVATNTGLKINDKITSSHGLIEEGIEDHGEHQLKVVGIFNPTNSVLDNLLITPLETVWKLHGHHNHHEEDDKVAHHHHNEREDEKPIESNEENKEITALLVKFRSPMGMLQIPRKINSETNMQAALTRYELERLFNFTGVGINVIRVIAMVILVISVFSIFISLYKIVRERRYELALMRVYGANRWQLITVVFFEGLIIGILGYLLGILMSRFGSHILYNYMHTEFKYTIATQLITFADLYLLLSILGLLIVATAFAIIPLFKLNVSKILTNDK